MASFAWVAVLIGLAAAGYVLHTKAAWMSRFTVVTGLGVFLAGLKKALDLWGKVTEFEKKQLELEKLEFEVVEKRRAADKEEQLITIATFEQTLEFGQSRLRNSIDQAARSGLRIYGTVLSLIIIVSIGWTVFVTQPIAIKDSRVVQKPAVPAPQAPPPAQPDSNPRVTSTAVPPLPKRQKPSIEPDRGLSPQTTPSKPARGRNCSLADSEIPSYLNLAERYRDSGKYESAIRNYNLVLGCQPGNRQAQAGLRTAEEMEKYSH